MVINVGMAAITVSIDLRKSQLITRLSLKAEKSTLIGHFRDESNILHSQALDGFMNGLIGCYSVGNMNGSDWETITLTLLFLARILILMMSSKAMLEHATF